MNKELISSNNENSQSPKGEGYLSTAQGVFKVCSTPPQNTRLEKSNPITASGGIQENKKLLIFCTEGYGLLVSQTNEIRNKIYTLRGLQVMIDNDLAELYNVKIKVLNQAAKRNKERFPFNFMFQLTDDESNSLRSQIVTLNKGRGTHRKYLPYAFTEQGVAMLSGILKSDTAIRVSIQIMNAFVTMRRFLSSNALFFQRIERTEQKMLEYDRKFDEIFDAIQSKDIKPEKGIFFDGQIFDAYAFVSDLIRSAKKSIVLVDNYVDDSVLTLFSKRSQNIKVIIFTKDVSKQLMLDLEKHNSQYPPIKAKEFSHSHDRFLIIDDDVYHFGASLKDLGKKWFGFSKFSKEAFKLLEKLGLERD